MSYKMDMVSPEKHEPGRNNNDSSYVSESMVAF